MEKSDRFLRLELQLEPVLPAHEVAIAYLNGCGFSMFEEQPTGLVAFAGNQNGMSRERKRCSLNYGRWPM